MINKFFSFTQKGGNGEPNPVPDFKVEQCVPLLHPKMHYFTEAFYEKLQKIMPENFSLAFDNRAPNNPCPGKSTNGESSCLSLELKMVRDQKSYKYGTGRVAMREKHYFAKTVTWKTPIAFLHQRVIYEIIRAHFQGCQVVRNRSKTRNGFTIKDKSKVITIEVFGSNALNSYLACDITLSRFNQPLARQRMQAFLDFYGDLYNHVRNSELHFKARTPDDVEFPEIQIIDTAQEGSDNLLGDWH